VFLFFGCPSVRSLCILSFSLVDFILLNFLGLLMSNESELVQDSLL
jgi:hypothetical protein